MRYISDLEWEKRKGFEPLLGKDLYVEVSPRLACIALHVLLICLRSGFTLIGVRTCLYSRFSRTMVTSSLVRDVPQSIGRTSSALFSRG